MTKEGTTVSIRILLFNFHLLTLLRPNTKDWTGQNMWSLKSIYCNLLFPSLLLVSAIITVTVSHGHISKDAKSLGGMTNPTRLCSL